MKWFKVGHRKVVERKYGSGVFVFLLLMSLDQGLVIFSKKALYLYNLVFQPHLSRLQDEY